MAEHTKYEAVIGLEVHAQLSTKSKSFSPDGASFGAAPNHHIDIISLAQPGTLPILNRTHIQYAIKMGLATNCHIEPHSIIARKHYFYPDSPKGYQISQYELPICTNGMVSIKWEDSDGTVKQKNIRLTRIHIEEDAGKSIHDQDPYDSLIDINRSGVPLIEIVTEPDIRSAQEAVAYLKQIRQLVRYLEICDGNMEEGSLRCDANISIREVGNKELGTKTELKNMNSFRNVERAITHEIKRQIRQVECGHAIVQETLLWDPTLNESRSMRSKEEAHDYRYMPDPDLAPINLTEQYIEQIRERLPELPERKKKRFESVLQLPSYDAALLSEERSIAQYFENTLTALKNLSAVPLAQQAKLVSNFMMTEVFRVINESSLEIDQLPVSSEKLAQLLQMRLEDKISSNGAQALFEALMTSNENPESLANSLNLLQVSDTETLVPLIENILLQYPKEVERFRAGEKQLVGFFIGQVMRTFEGSPDPKLVRTILFEKLNEQ